MTFYETNQYLVIIYYTDFETRIRSVKKEDLEKFIEKLNNSEEVFDYTITKKIDFDY